MNSELQGAFSDVRKLRKTLIAILWITVALAPIALVLNFIERTVLQSVIDANLVPTDEMIAAADASDRNTLIMGVVQIAVFIASTIVWFMWVFRSNKLARALGATNMNYTPGWSVGWFFIPIANLFKPYFAMKEIYLATISPKDFTVDQEVEDQPESLNVLKLWWLFYIVDRVVASAANRTSWRAETVDDLASSNTLLIASDIGALVGALMTIWLVREFTNQQDKAFAGASSDEGLQPQTTSE